MKNILYSSEFIWIIKIDYGDSLSFINDQVQNKYKEQSIFILVQRYQFLQ